MLVKGSKIVQYFIENSVYINYDKSLFIHYDNYFDEKLSLNCLLNSYFVSETNNMKFLGVIVVGRGGEMN